MWCIPKIDEEFEKRMLDVLEVYERPYDAKKPVICLDEKSVELREPARPSKPCAPGRIKRIDSEYIRKGTANVFMAVEPKGCRRFPRVTKRRTALDFARYTRSLLMHPYRDIEKLVLVMDNLNTHGESSFTKTFGEREGKRLWDRIEPHYTPKHGSWLDMAEIELSVFSNQCLAHRKIASRQELRRQTSAWSRRRNRKRIGITWQFTKTDAIKKFHLKRSYGILS